MKFDTKFDIGAEVCFATKHGVKKGKVACVMVTARKHDKVLGRHETHIKYVIEGNQEPVLELFVHETFEAAWTTYERAMVVPEDR